MAEFNIRDLSWGDVFYGLSLMRFAEAIQVLIIEGTASMSFSLSPDEAEDVAAKLQLLAKEARNAPSQART